MLEGGVRGRVERRLRGRVVERRVAEAAHRHGVGRLAVLLQERREVHGDQAVVLAGRQQGAERPAGIDGRREWQAKDLVATPEIGPVRVDGGDFPASGA